MEKVPLKTTATCGHPPELRGQNVRDVHVFKGCPEEKVIPGKSFKGPKTPKSSKPKPTILQVTEGKVKLPVRAIAKPNIAKPNKAKAKPEKKPPLTEYNKKAVQPKLQI